MLVLRSTIGILTIRPIKEIIQWHFGVAACYLSQTGSGGDTCTFLARMSLDCCSPPLQSFQILLTPHLTRLLVFGQNINTFHFQHPPSVPSVRFGKYSTKGSERISVKTNKQTLCPTSPNK